LGVQTFKIKKNENSEKRVGLRQSFISDDKIWANRAYRVSRPVYKKMRLTCTFTFWILTTLLVSFPYDLPRFFYEETFLRQIWC